MTKAQMLKNLAKARAVRKANLKKAAKKKTSKKRVIRKNPGASTKTITANARQYTAFVKSKYPSKLKFTAKEKGYTLIKKIPGFTLTVYDGKVIGMYPNPKR